MNQYFLKILQQRTGQLAIGRSTLRNQGAPGVIGRARSFLQNLELSEFRAVSTNEQYLQFLEDKTMELSESFPDGAKGNWGAARKALNIFFRDCLYNAYLNKEYSIERLRGWLEIPLDGDVARNLYALYKPSLPKWPNIRCLTPEISSIYQQKASEKALKVGIARVDLDIYYWRDGHYTINH
jgi:hypothetical protein